VGEGRKKEIGRRVGVNKQGSDGMALMESGERVGGPWGTTHPPAASLRKVLSTGWRGWRHGVTRAGGGGWRQGMLMREGGRGIGGGTMMGLE
jgi:hypothetical protein